MSNIGIHQAREVARAMNPIPISPFFIAEVVSVDDFLVTILPEGVASTPGSQLIGTAAGYTPEVGDRVICAWINGEPFALATIATEAAGGNYLSLLGGTVGGTTIIQVDNALANAFMVIDEDFRKTFWVSTGYHEAGIVSGGDFNGYSDNLVTKTWTMDAATGNVEFAAILGKSFNSPVFAFEVQDTPTDSTNTSNVTWDTNVEASITLPTGTWTVYGLTAGSYVNASISSVRQRTRIGASSAGSYWQMLCDSGLPTNFVTLHSLTGQTGTVTVYGQYQPATNGQTVTARGGSVLIWAIRTA